MNNGLNRGNASTKEGIVEEQALSALKGGLTFQEIVNSGNIELSYKGLQKQALCNY